MLGPYLKIARDGQVWASWPKNCDAPCSVSCSVSPVPVWAYQVSGEYAMIEHAAAAGVIDRERAGFALVSIISVTLATHTEGNAERFARLVRASPNILEAHALTGEMDYSIKVVTEDLHALSDFINRTLLAHEAVQNVKTAIVLNTVKDTSALPLAAE